MRIIVLLKERIGIKREIGLVSKSNSIEMFLQGGSLFLRKGVLVWVRRMSEAD